MEKGVSDKLALLYLKKVKKWIPCPKCRGKVSKKGKEAGWSCEGCGYALQDSDFKRKFMNEVCRKCGKMLSTTEKHLCAECDLKRKEKQKNAIVIGSFLAVVAAIAIANKDAIADEEEQRWTGDGEYPTCDSCGSLMTEFDGCWWYACPNCGNRIRSHSDGSWTWARDIFDEGTKSHTSDYGLADFSRGGDLSED